MDNVIKSLKLKAGPSYTVNERLSLRNVLVFKSVYCSHYSSCFKHISNGLVSRFIKGYFLNVMFKFLLSYTQEVNSKKIKLSFMQRLSRIIFQPNYQLIYTGLFASSVGTVYKFLNCLMKYLLFFNNKEAQKYQHFLSGFWASFILLPLFLPRPYRKMLCYFGLALAFECIWKLLVYRHDNGPPKNKFEQRY